MKNFLRKNQIPFQLGSRLEIPWALFLSIPAAPGLDLMLKCFEMLIFSNIFVQNSIKKQDLQGFLISVTGVKYGGPLELAQGVPDIIK